MSENTETKPAEPALWTFVVDPKKPMHSLVQYKGESLSGVIQAAVSLEPLPVPGEAGEQRHTIVSVLTLKVVVQSLALGTYDAPLPKPPEPVQQELPLGDKTP